MVVLLVGCVLAAPACRKPKAPSAPAAPPQLVFQPAAAARPDLVAQVLLPSWQRSLQTLGTIAQRLGLPFSAPDMQKSLAGSNGLPPAVMDRIDLGKPITIAFFGGEAARAASGANYSPVVAFALRDSSTAGFDAFAAGAGKVTERSKDAVKVDRGDAAGMRPLWLVPRDGAVCASQSAGMLQAGCSLALQGRGTGGEDVRATIVPDGVASANGTTVPQALAKLRQQLSDQQAAALAASPTAGKDARAQQAALKFAEAGTGYFLDFAGDVAEAHWRLALDSAQGLTSTIEARPRVASRLAKQLTTRSPYALDPALLVAPRPGALGAVGSVALYKDMIRMLQPVLLENAANDKERMAMTRSIDTFFASLAGPMSVRFDIPPGNKLAYRYDVSYALRPGVDPKQVLAAVQNLLAGPWLKRVMEVSGGGMKMKLSTLREKETVVVRMSVDPRSLPPELSVRGKGLPLLDGRPLEARVAVAGDRLLMSMGPDARTSLAALMAGATGGPGAGTPPGAPGIPTGDAATALAETRGDDSFFYVDLAALLRPMLAVAGQAAGGAAPPGSMSVLAQIDQIASSLRLGMWGSHRGGSTLTLRWRLPMTTMESAGTAARAFMGMRGAAAGAAREPGAVIVPGSPAGAPPSP